MPTFSPTKAFVTSAEIGGGKAVIEIKNPKSTMTLELPEDSGWVKMLPEGAFVTYTIEVELPRGVDPTPGGPLPGDEIKTSQGIVTIPESNGAVLLTPLAANVPPDPEEIRKNNPIRGQRTVGLNHKEAGESVRDLLGIPDHSGDPVATTAQANLQAHAQAPSSSPTPL